VALSALCRRSGTTAPVPTETGWKAASEHQKEEVRLVDSVLMQKVEQMINSKPVVLFIKNDAKSSMAKTLLSNVLYADDIRIVDISDDNCEYIQGIAKSQGLAGPASELRSFLRKELRHLTGHAWPFTFLDGKSYGTLENLMDDCLSTVFCDRVRAHGLKVKEYKRDDADTYGYPKGLPKEQISNGKKNVLLMGCGSSASDKIPRLAIKLKEAGHNVKVAVSDASRHFFKEHEEKQLFEHITHEDFYTNEDEWSFPYASFNMSVRATHLALRLWADIVVVAPVTCNTMGKICAGVGDTLVTECFVAWEWYKKPVILAPAMNTDMYYSPVTQRNLATLKSFGATILGPVKATLSNGQVGIGVMSAIPDIVAEVGVQLQRQEFSMHWMLDHAKNAAHGHNTERWMRIYQQLEEESVTIEAADGNGDTMLHFACGGAGDIHEDPEKAEVDLEVVKKLLTFKPEINKRNTFGCCPLAVAALSNSPSCVDLLLGAGADASAVIGAPGEIRNKSIKKKLLDKMDPGKKAEAESQTPFIKSHKL